MWADHLTPTFDGWSTRDNVVATPAATVEGDRGEAAQRAE
jgi:hypothetical protein